MKTNILRTSLVLNILGLCFLFAIDMDHTSMSVIVPMFLGLIGLTGLNFYIFKRMDVDKVNEVLMVDNLKKIGINLEEE